MENLTLLINADMSVKKLKAVQKFEERIKIYQQRRAKSEGSRSIQQTLKVIIYIPFRTDCDFKTSILHCTVGEETFLS